MPKYNFTCSTCGARRTRIFLQPWRMQTIATQEASKRCPRGCTEPMGRDDPAVTTAVVETLDNGAMSRKVERFADAERLYKERAAGDPRNKG